MACKTTTSKKTEMQSAAESATEKKVKTAGSAAKAVKASPKVTNGKKASVKKPAVKPGPVAAKAAPRKTVTKPVASEKGALKKAVIEKAIAKKTVPKKAAPKKSTPKKAVTKKAVPEKAVAKKTAPKKAAPKKAVPKKAAPTKSVTKKAAVAKAAPIKTAVKKAVVKDAMVKQTAASRKAAVKSKAAAAMAKPRTILDLDQPTGMYNGIVLCEKVKPFPSKTPYTLKELDKLREVLRGEQQQLSAALNSLKGASMEAFDVAKDHPGYSIHMAEHATDLQTAETNLGVRSIEADRLSQVEQALDRIEHNVSKYGLCLACGSKIGIQRLIARPHAHLCMTCRTRYEEIRRRRGL